MTKRDDMPVLDPGAVIQYSAIRYVAGYPESYVKEYALQYAEQRVREERAEDGRLLREALTALQMSRSDNFVESVKAHLLGDNAIAALRKRLGE